ncbi:MAG: hypothetical protein AAB489_02155 [Patescibacteria group bacterium]
MRHLTVELTETFAGFERGFHQRSLDSEDHLDLAEISEHLLQMRTVTQISEERLNALRIESLQAINRAAGRHYTVASEEIGQLAAQSKAESYHGILHAITDFPRLLQSETARINSHFIEQSLRINARECSEEERQRTLLIARIVSLHTQAERLECYLAVMHAGPPAEA